MPGTFRIGLFLERIEETGSIPAPSGHGAAGGMGGGNAGLVTSGRIDGRFITFSKNRMCRSYWSARSRSSIRMVWWMVVPRAFDDLASVGGSRMKSKTTFPITAN